MMNRFIFTVLLLCGMYSVATAAQIDAVVLKHMESEPGLQPFSTRTIVTPRYIRMDDGEEGGDYLIFDREQKVISSVTHEDETVLEIPLKTVDKQMAPMELKRRDSLTPDSKAPLVSGKSPQKLQLYVNDKLCYDAVVVPGLQEDVVRALRSFKQVLAGEQGKMLADLPVEMMEACDMALHTFYPEWTLSAGLAIQEWDESLRKGRMLLELQESVPVDSKLFTLPENYKRYQTP